MNKVAAMLQVNVRLRARAVEATGASGATRRVVYRGCISTDATGALVWQVLLVVTTPRISLALRHSPNIEQHQPKKQQSK
jgi:MOSC domain-containing protein YiiM